MPASAAPASTLLATVGELEILAMVSQALKLERGSADEADVTR
jgi:hypothetical protein